MTTTNGCPCNDGGPCLKAWCPRDETERLSKEVYLLRDAIDKSNAALEIAVKTKETMISMKDAVIRLSIAYQQNKIPLPDAMVDAWAAVNAEIRKVNELTGNPTDTKVK